MEDSAIREGFANLRPSADYDGLRDAALCRAKADWLVGINATRLFSVLYHRTLNIGRVMSPTPVSYTHLIYLYLYRYLWPYDRNLPCDFGGSRSNGCNDG